MVTQENSHYQATGCQWWHRQIHTIKHQVASGDTGKFTLSSHRLPVVTQKNSHYQATGCQWWHRQIHTIKLQVASGNTGKFTLSSQRLPVVTQANSHYQTSGCQWCHRQIHTIKPQVASGDTGKFTLSSHKILQSKTREVRHELPTFWLWSRNANHSTKTLVCQPSSAATIGGLYNSDYISTRLNRTFLDPMSQQINWFWFWFWYNLSSSLSVHNL